jgi:sigma-B regulation protein RsbU (phosphoserine phosphatase)
MVDDFPNGRFVTMIYAVLDAGARTLSFASAGHLPPLLVDAEGTRFLATDRGMPLGLAFGEYSESTIRIREGSQIVFYSDGITEAEGSTGEEYGALRLKDHVTSKNASADSILSDVLSFANGAGLHDDATVIFVRG